MALATIVPESGPAISLVALREITCSVVRLFTGRTARIFQRSESPLICQTHFSQPNQHDDAQSLGLEDEVRAGLSWAPGKDRDSDRERAADFSGLGFERLLSPIEVVHVARNRLK